MKLSNYPRGMSCSVIPLKALKCRFSRKCSISIACIPSYIRKPFYFYREPWRPCSEHFLPGLLLQVRQPQLGSSSSRWSREKGIQPLPRASPVLGPTLGKSRLEEERACEKQKHKRDCTGQMSLRGGRSFLRRGLERGVIMVCSA